MSKDYTMQCPMCLNETKYIIQHLSKSKNCKIPGDLATFRDQFGLYKEKFKKEQHRKHQKALTARKKAEDEAKVKEQHRKCQEASMARKREEDEAKVKEQQRQHQDTSRAKKRAEDEAKVKEQQRQHQDTSRAKKRVEELGSAGLVLVKQADEHVHLAPGR